MSRRTTVPWPISLFSRASSNPTAVPNTNVETLKMISYNVWFDGFMRAERARALFDEIRRLQPDFVCLQEVTPWFVEAVRKEAWLCQTYHMTDPGTGETIHPYGNLTLSRYPVKIQFSPFQSRMYRKLVCVVAEVNGEQVAVGNVHFESLNSAPLRKIQHEFCHDYLAQYPNAFLMGDFNFCSEKNFSGGPPTENMDLLAKYVDYRDVWPFLHPTEKGYTFDSEVNPMLNHREQMRYDRILARSNVWVPSCIEILGTHTIATEPRPTTISDHFGLYTEFKQTKRQVVPLS